LHPSGFHCIPLENIPSDRAIEAVKIITYLGHVNVNFRNVFHARGKTVGVAHRQRQRGVPHEAGAPRHVRQNYRVLEKEERYKKSSEDIYLAAPKEVVGDNGERQYPWGWSSEGKKYTTEGDK
jgi:hypothetical protein